MPSNMALNTVSPYARYLPRPIADVATDLESFCELLTRWNATQSLVSRETLPDIWKRHMSDSLQLLPLLRSGDRRLTDVGSGGGFPALPLAIALKGSGSRHLLIEANGKKASFLRTVIRVLALDAEVATVRAEAVDSRETAQVITARAVAPLDELLRLAAPLFGRVTRGLFHKGREYGEEMQRAAAAWQFDVLVHGSRTDPEGVLLEIENLQRRQ